ncbi:unnamed protein product [Meganyctiphanes norvegica]|uniref:Ig-like domain-containing protein n=1 Tax=Meganyctiphanes norvegica TaxID=48144 RepID=A0AAV2RL43_MEGNR
MKMRTLDGINGIISILYTVWSLTLINVVVVYAEQRFADQPESVTVKHGRAVVLRCKVLDKKGIIQWTKDGFGLGTDTDLEGFSRYKMETNESEGVYNLHIQPVLVEDQAEYQCQVGGADGEGPLRSTIAKITVHFPPTEDRVKITKASPVETTEGAPIRLFCEAGLSSPAAQIKWYNDNEEISSGVNVTKHQMPNSILNSVRSFLDLTPEQKHHKSNITCKVSHEALESPIERYVVMHVKYKPVVKISVDSPKILESEDVRLTCDAHANPGGLRYRWEIDGETVIGDHTTEYIIKDVSRLRNGVKIGCFVSNVIGSSSADHKLSVQFSPVFKSEPKDVDADEGKSVTLNCDVDSNPPPNIHWTFGKGSNKAVSLGSTFKLEKLSRENAGSYFCWAHVPGFSDVSRHIEVYMREAPEIQAEANQFGMEGETIHVVCDIRGIPRPSKNDVEWTRHGVIINANDTHYDILQEATRNGAKSTLLIHDASSEDFGLYNCTAKNGYGKDIGEIKLNRQQSLPLVTTLVAIIGGIIFLVVVMVVIILFKKKGKGYKDPTLEKHSMHSSDHSSTHDSVMKVDNRTATGSDLSPSEEDDDYSHTSDWETSDTGHSNNRGQDLYRYTSEYNDATFPPKGPNNARGDYVQYVDYNSRDYNPPPPPPPANYNRNSAYSAAPLNNVDPRYSAAYGNPYLRIPSSTNPAAVQNPYGTTGTKNIEPGVSTNQNFYNVPPNNTLNNMNQNNIATYGQIGQNRNNLRSSGNMNNQYIMVPQGEPRHAVLGTHI